MTSEAVIGVVRLGFPWPTVDPFLFCVHHNDAYPAGDERMGPVASLAGRSIGADFSGKDGWSMYHGDHVPGFPMHPHRGFETITIARRGFIDHSDSMGATARFGQGDVQWMTAGGGVVHAEMFPLVRRDASNPVELFQIWLNLPRADKMKEAYFTMFWKEQVPVFQHADASGRGTEVTVVAGALGEVQPLAPPPSSWASRPEASVGVWSILMEAGARWTPPQAPEGVQRVFYVFGGEGVSFGGRRVERGHAAQVRPEVPCELVNGGAPAEVLMLQGRPIGEPVVQRGPFVMSSAAEIQQTMQDYQRTGFGGWPWRGAGPVHGREEGRFAKHADGRGERPA